MTASPLCFSKRLRLCWRSANSRTGPSARVHGRRFRTSRGYAGPGRRCLPRGSPPLPRRSAGSSRGCPNGTRHQKSHSPRRFRSPRPKLPPGWPGLLAKEPKAGPPRPPMPRKLRTCSSRAGAKGNPICCWPRRAPGSARRWAISLRLRSGRKVRAERSGSQPIPRPCSASCAAKAAAPGLPRGPMVPRRSSYARGARITSACSTLRTRCKAGSTGARRSWRS